jgi:hypothetical protein
MNYLDGNYYVTNYYSTVDGLNKGRENFAYGGFSVKAGDIVYIGNIDADLHEGKLKTLDRYDNAVAYFRKKHPNLATHPIKKDLLKPAGTLLKDLYFK